MRVQTELKKIPGRVFYVFSKNDSTVLLALNLVIDGQMVRWFDSVKERIMTVKRIHDINPEHFVFERTADEGGGIYTFTPMTLEIYNKEVKKHILVPQEFTNEEALLKAFEETRRNAW